MKRIYLLFFILAAPILASAQAYSCISPEAKTYFTNAGGYLRGMRIDSVKWSGHLKVSYPFKTARVGMAEPLPRADTTGGSWLGGVMIEDTLNGISHIPTINGDTVTIDNKAGLNHSWIFYQDTSSRYFTATIVDMDTATFAGITDSVKFIQIHAMEGNSVMTADALNGLTLILSKSHGFFEVCGLYLFPYKASGTMNADYYFQASASPEYDNRSEGHVMFKRVKFQFPVYEKIYNFDTGDVFAAHSDDAPQIHTYSNTRITQKTVTATSFDYQFHYSNSWVSGPTNGSDSGTDTLYYHFGTLIDTLKMPEEWHQPRILHYWPKDTSYCVVSPVYQTDLSQIDWLGILNNFEPSTNTEVYKNYLGNIYSFQVDGAGGPVPPMIFNLDHAKKQDHDCSADNQPLSISESKMPLEQMIIYPNPSHGLLYIKRNISAPFKEYRVSIYNFLGQKVLSKTFEKSDLHCLNIENLSGGMYLINISGKGFNLSRKLLLMR